MTGRDQKISARGVYYDLTISPYEYKTPYGEIFKFSSKKKLDIYSRDVPKEIQRVEKLLSRNDLRDQIEDEFVQLLIKAVYRAFYRKTEV